VALVVLEVSQHAWGDDIEPSHGLGEAGLNIEVPVSRTVADHIALQVHLHCCGVAANLLVVDVHLPSEEGNVDTGVTFT
jgi:hypothetical protein